MRWYICILVILLMAVPLSALHAQEQGIAQITTPAEGAQLFGLVEILGTATHPSLFDGYVLEWSNVQNPDVWLPIQQRIGQQVVNGVLGQWDTAGSNIPDGSYQIRLRMFLTDGSVQDFVLRSLTLINSAPTDLPTVIPAQATSTLSVLPTAGPSPTSIILQPPSVTPRPTFESPLQDDSGSSSDSGNSTVVNFGAAQGAFCTGVFFSVGLFALIIAYIALRSRLSPFTRRLWWQIRSELDND
jgi:hypothetical protein